MGVPKTTKSGKVSNPVESSSKGFFAVVGALVLVAVAVFGLIMYNGNKEKQERLQAGAEAIEGVAMDFDPDNGKITLSAENANVDSAQKFSLFEDFLCPHCAELAAETDDKMLEEINGGNLIVEFSPMTFMDGNKEGSSHELLAATLAAADSGDESLYWNLRKGFLENQFEYVGKSREDYAELAAAYDADEETVQAIKDGKFMDMAANFGDMNEKEMESKNNGEVGTPLVITEDNTVMRAGEWVNHLNSM